VEIFSAAVFILNRRRRREESLNNFNLSLVTSAPKKTFDPAAESFVYFAWFAVKLFS